MPLSTGFADTAAGMGIGMAGGIVNGLIGQAFAEHNRQRNFYYNELAAENADKRARAQFADMYSLPAQMRQIKEAGMSPSILYAGNGSQGGSVGAQGAGVMGIDAPYQLLDPMTEANVELMKSEARKNNVEADTAEGKNTLGEQMIQSWIKKNLGQDLVNDYQTIQNYIANESKEADINKRLAEADQAATKAQTLIYEMVTSQVAAEIADATKQDKIDYAELINKELIARALEEGELAKLHKKQRDYLQGQIEYYAEKALREFIELGIKNADQKTRAQWMKDMNEFWDATIENMNNRLNHDINYDWSKLAAGIFNDGLDRGADMLIHMTPAGMLKGGPVHVSGFGDKW